MLLVSGSIPVSLWGLIVVSSLELSGLVAEGLLMVGMFIPYAFLNLLVIGTLGWFLIFPCVVIGILIAQIKAGRIDLGGWIWIVTSITGFMVMFTDWEPSVIHRFVFFFMQQIVITAGCFLYDYCLNILIGAKDTFSFTRLFLMLFLSIYTLLTAIGISIFSGA